MISLFRRVLTYRLTLYYLAALVGAAVILAASGIVQVPAVYLAFTTLLLLAVCWAVNRTFAKSFGATSNPESVLITGLILTMILSPVAPNDVRGIGLCVFAAAWAMASKYMLAINKKHIFNPAAFGAALAGLALHRTVSWWVGDNAVLLPVIILGGLLVLTRLRYFALLASFAVMVMAVTAFEAPPGHIVTSLSLMALHSMFFFFGLVMLTEPRTTPLGRWRQIAYGALIGLLFAPTTHIGNYYFTPEVAILVGNLFGFLANRRRLRRWAEAWA